MATFTARLISGQYAAKQWEIYNDDDCYRGVVRNEWPGVYVLSNVLAGRHGQFSTFEAAAQEAVR